MAHELAHVKNRDTLIMTMTATIAGAISMLANFAFFFGGGRDRNNPLGAHRHHPDDDPGAASPPCWCRWRSAARANMAPTAAAPRSPASRWRSPRRWRKISGAAASHREPTGGSQSGHGAHVHHQSAVGRAHGQSLLHPSQSEEPDRCVDGHGPGNRRRPEFSGFGSVERHAVGAPGSLGLRFCRTRSRVSMSAALRFSASPKFSRASAFPTR